MRRCFKSSCDNLSIRLPAPFMLFQTVPKLPPKPGTHPVLEKQFFWLIYLTCTRKRLEILRLWFLCFFPAEPQSAVCVTWRTEESIRDTIKVGACYALKMWSVAPNVTPRSSQSVCHYEKRERSYGSKQSASTQTLLNLVSTIFIINSFIQCLKESSLLAMYNQLPS